MNQQDFRESALRLLRHTFKQEFKKAALEWRDETDAIRKGLGAGDVQVSYQEVAAKAKMPDPFTGKHMPVRPNNDSGSNFTDPVHNMVVGRYADPQFKDGIDKEFEAVVKKLNGFIGQEFATAEIAGLRETLTQAWGEQMNISLPFSTGQEQYYGTPYAEVVLEAAHRGFVVRGFGYDRSCFRHNIER